MHLYMDRMEYIVEWEKPRDGMASELIESIWSN